MILSIGLDIVEVERIAKAMQNPRFVNRVLTAEERKICKTPMRVAGRWAAKEAIAKALGTHLTWQQVEVLRDRQGAPKVRIHARGFDHNAARVHISITHERGIAAAVAVQEKIISPPTL